MAALPTPEESGRAILAIFSRFNVRPGNMLMFGTVHPAFLQAGYAAADFKPAMQWLESNSYIDLKGKPTGPYFLTDAGYEAL